MYEQYSTEELKKAVGLRENTVLPCTILDYISTLANQARAWQLLSHLADQNAPNLTIASNRLAQEIEKARGDFY